MQILTVAAMLCFGVAAIVAFTLELLYDKEVKKAAAHKEAERRNKKWQ